MKDATTIYFALFIVVVAGFALWVLIDSRKMSKDEKTNDNE